MASKFKLRTINYRRELSHKGQGLGVLPVGAAAAGGAAGGGDGGRSVVLSSSSSSSAQSQHPLHVLGSPVGARTRARAHIKQEGVHKTETTTTLTTIRAGGAGTSAGASGAAATGNEIPAGVERPLAPPPNKPVRRIYSATGAVLTPLALVLAKATTNRYCVAASVVSYAPKDLSRFVRR